MSSISQFVPGFEKTLFFTENDVINMKIQIETETMNISFDSVFLFSDHLCNVSFLSDQEKVRCQEVSRGVKKKKQKTKQKNETETKLRS